MVLRIIQWAIYFLRNEKKYFLLTNDTSWSCPTRKGFLVWKYKKKWNFWWEKKNMHYSGILVSVQGTVDIRLNCSHGWKKLTNNGRSISQNVASFNILVHDVKRIISWALNRQVNLFEKDIFVFLVPVVYRQFTNSLINRGRGGGGGFVEIFHEF